MPRLTVDGIEIEAEFGNTVLQVCEKLGIEIPHFCYHERLSIAGNCRMCLVEVSPGPSKPQASCALPVSEGMIVRTNSHMIQQARRSVMEFLLINHPLDCPICDQGGECDLQDQAIAYGKDVGQYFEEKRAVLDKYLGPLIKTYMTRCIHCTRCVRFMHEIAGAPVLGTIFRGEHMEIATYLGQAIESELSGNLVDLCPVGALTSRPYAFKARPWELHKTESVDILDALGSAIRIDSRNNHVMRIVPRLNEEINEEWISDKTRYACDALSVQRLDKPCIRRDNILQPISWAEAFSIISEKLKTLKPEEIAAIAGDLADCEAMVALKDLMTSLGVVNLDCRQDSTALEAKIPAAYRFNTTLSGLEIADVLLLIGTNPQLEAPVLNARIHKNWMRRGLKIAAIGSDNYLSYSFQFLGDGPETIKVLSEGKHPFWTLLRTLEHPMIIIGQGVLKRSDGWTTLGLARILAETTNCIQKDWNGFNVLHTAASRTGGLMLQFTPGEDGCNVLSILEKARRGEISFVYLLNADEINMEDLGQAFVVYQGHHCDAGAKRADIVLPGAAYTEKTAIYVNTEGRVQSTRRAVFPPGEAREDWRILRALSAEIGQPLPYNSHEEVRARLVQIEPAFSLSNKKLPEILALKELGSPSGQVIATPFRSSIDDFYCTDPISRASLTMATCRDMKTIKAES